MNVFSFRIKEKSFSVDINDDYLKAKMAMSNDPYRKNIIKIMFSILDANYKGKNIQFTYLIMQQHNLIYT